MNKIISIILLICIVLMMTACNLSEGESTLNSENSDESISDTETTTDNDNYETNQTEEKDMYEESDTESKILVVYFSCTGTTEQIAEWIAGGVGADPSALESYSFSDVTIMHWAVVWLIRCRMTHRFL